MKTHQQLGISLGLGFLALVATPSLSHGAGQPDPSESQAAGTPAQTSRDYSFGEVVSESVTGNVYAEPSKWQELSARKFFSEGWDKPWASPPRGAGNAPRMGWINANDGVFYRLSIATLSWQHGLAKGSDGYSAYLTSYTPLNQRFEIRTDIGLMSNRGLTGRADAQTNFGDFVITPRFLLSEDKAQSQSLDIAFRTPTGDKFNGHGIAAISPQYNFWTNYWGGLVVRGGLGFTIPYAGDIRQTGWRSMFNTNLAIGYYFTTHDQAPFGDLVFYVANNFTQAIDNRGPSTTWFSLGPGFRSHLGDNWYLLGAVEFSVTHPQPYDYQVTGGIMKVY